MSFGTLGTIASAGVGTGLPFQDMVDQLVAAEGKFKLERFNKDEAKALAKITGYGNIKSSLADFKDNLTILKDSNKFNSKKTSISNDQTSSSLTAEYFLATAGNGAITANYNIEVEQLATVNKLGSKIFNTSSTVVGTGTLKITKDSTTYSIDISSDDQTVDGIKAAINNKTRTTGIVATTITSDDGVQLVISGEEPGSKNAITIEVENDGDGNNTNNSGLSQLISSNMTVMQSALDSIVVIDNSRVTTSSNKLVDVIDGVTIELKKAEDGKVHNLSVATDIDAVKNNIQKFVDNYNSFIDIKNDLTKFDSSREKQHGDLFGDPTLRNVANKLEAELFSTITDPTSITSLAVIGITVSDTDSKLLLDSSKLTSKLNSNFSDVSNLFSNSLSGIATSMYDTVNELTSSTGLLGLRVTDLNDEINKIFDNRLILEDKLENMRIDLTLKFSRLDALLAGFQQMGDRLAQEIGGAGVAPLSFKRK